MHWLDLDYLPVTSGVVERFIINPDGEVDGFLLTDQILVHTPPHLSDQLKSAIRPGDSVRVRGVKPRGAEVIAAVSVETTTGSIVIDHGPEAIEAESGDEPANTTRVPMDASGTVRLTLFAPKGQARGALLQDGTILRLGHKEAHRLVDRLQPGAQISVRGEGLATEHGRVIEIREIGQTDGTFKPIKKPKDELAEDAASDVPQAMA